MLHSPLNGIDAVTKKSIKLCANWFFCTSVMGASSLATRLKTACLYDFWVDPCELPEGTLIVDGCDGVCWSELVYLAEWVSSISSIPMSPTSCLTSRMSYTIFYRDECIYYHRIERAHIHLNAPIIYNCDCDVRNVLPPLSDTCRRLYTP